MEEEGGVERGGRRRERERERERGEGEVERGGRGREGRCDTHGCHPILCISKSISK